MGAIRERLRRFVRPWADDVRDRPHEPRYDAWLHFGNADVCNLRCEYCISDSPGFPAPKTVGGRIEPMDVERLLAALEASGRTFKVVFAGGGEPFLIPNFVDVCAALARKHYVAVHSNLTIPEPVRDFAERVDPYRVLYIVGSFHADELQRTGFTDRYFEAFALLARAGFDVRGDVVAHPDLVSRADAIRELFAMHHARLEFSPFLGMYDGVEYPQAYTDRERSLLGLDDSSIHRPKGKPCNAGFNVGLVLPNGDVQMCSELGTKLGNVYERFEFRDVPVICPAERCRCPFYAYDDRLFEAALGLGRDASGLGTECRLSSVSDLRRQAQSR